MPTPTFNAFTFTQDAIKYTYEIRKLGDDGNYSKVKGLLGYDLDAAGDANAATATAALAVDIAAKAAVAEANADLLAEPQDVDLLEALAAAQVNADNAATALAEANDATTKWHKDYNASTKYELVVSADISDASGTKTNLETLDVSFNFNTGENSGLFTNWDSAEFTYGDAFETAKAESRSAGDSIQFTGAVTDQLGGAVAFHSDNAGYQELFKITGLQIDESVAEGIATAAATADAAADTAAAAAAADDAAAVAAADAVVELTAAAAVADADADAAVAAADTAAAAADDLAADATAAQENLGLLQGITADAIAAAFLAEGTPQEAEAEAAYQEAFTASETAQVDFDDAAAAADDAAATATTLAGLATAAVTAAGLANDAAVEAETHSSNANFVANQTDAAQLAADAAAIDGVARIDFSADTNNYETVFSTRFTEHGDDHSVIQSLAETAGDFAKGSVYISNDADSNVTIQEAKSDFVDMGTVLYTQRVIGSNEKTSLIRASVEDANGTVTGATVQAVSQWANIGSYAEDAGSVSLVQNVDSNITLFSEDYKLGAADAVVDAFSIDQSDYLGQINPGDTSGEIETAVFKVDVANYAVGSQVSGDGRSFYKLEGVNNVADDNTVTASRVSDNVITYAGDLNYDGRVSMKDLAFLNAGKVYQGEVDGNASDDVDANHDGNITVEDLAILSSDWNKSLHTAGNGGAKAKSDLITGDMNWGTVDAPNEGTYEEGSDLFTGANTTTIGHTIEFEMGLSNSTFNSQNDLELATPLEYTTAPTVEF